MKYLIRKVILNFLLNGLSYDAFEFGNTFNEKRSVDFMILNDGE